MLDTVSLVCYYNNREKETTKTTRVREVITMKTVIIDYAKISPAVLATIVERAFSSALCDWTDIDDDYCEFRVWGVNDLAMLEDILAEYV